MANFCLATGLAPTEYRKLTWVEYLSFIDQIERAG